MYIILLTWYNFIIRAAPSEDLDNSKRDVRKWGRLPYC